MPERTPPKAAKDRASARSTTEFTREPSSASRTHATRPSHRTTAAHRRSPCKPAARPQPEELSPAYVFLASPMCSGYITGIVLPVTGSIGAE